MAAHLQKISITTKPVATTKIHSSDVALLTFLDKSLLLDNRLTYFQQSIPPIGTSLSIATYCRVNGSMISRVVLCRSIMRTIAALEVAKLGSVVFEEVILYLWRKMTVHRWRLRIYYELMFWAVVIVRCIVESSAPLQLPTQLRQTYSSAMKCGALHNIMLNALLVYVYRTFEYLF